MLSEFMQTFCLKIMQLSPLAQNAGLIISSQFYALHYDKLTFIVGGFCSNGSVTWHDEMKLISQVLFYYSDIVDIKLYVVLLKLYSFLLVLVVYVNLGESKTKLGKGGIHYFTFNYY